MEDQPNEPNPNGLSAKHERAIIALLAEPCVKRAASAAGVGETTMFRWLSEEAFHSAYLEARRKVLQQATAQMQHHTSGATAFLVPSARTVATLAGPDIPGATGTLSQVPLTQAIACLTLWEPVSLSLNAAPVGPFFFP